MRKIFYFLVFILFFLVKPSFAQAEVIHSFDVDVKAYKNGLMNFKEVINYDFEDLDKHGIYRYIPLYSKVGDLYRIIKIDNIKVERDGKKEKFSLTKTKEEISIKIGDANKTITGNHSYTIFYTVENGIGSNYKDHDEIYWNATGNGWNVVIEKASFKIATDFNINPTDLICFTGYEGYTEKNCEVSKNAVTTKKILNPGEELTVVVKYPLNTFPKSILYKELPKTLTETIFGIIKDNYPLIYIFLNIISPIYLFVWYQRNRNKKKYGRPSVVFDFPKDEKGNVLLPAISGTIDTAKLEKDDVIATIFDLAIRKYIRLEEVKNTSKLLGVINTTKKDQIITKLKDSDNKLSNFEKNLLDRLFESGKSVSISTLRLDFYKTFEEMEKEVFKTLVEKKYYIKNPKNQKAIIFILGIFALIFLNIFLAITLFFLSVKLNGRTSLGDEVDFKIDGLKLFLKSMNRNYKWQAEKFYTVEQMIPYAMALGYIDKFMEQLKIIKPDYSPTWYKGYSGNFYGSYAGFYSAATTNITTSAQSSSSGFSGGSSGGGGGGGGGGSW